MLDQRRRRWADVVQMLYTCFVFAGYRVIISRLSRVYGNVFYKERENNLSEIVRIQNAG